MRAVFHVEGYELQFQWSGGEYIDISFAPDWEGGFTCINTFDHEGNKQEFTRENFLQEIMEWINDPETDHAHDLKEYAYGG